MFYAMALVIARLYVFIKSHLIIQLKLMTALQASSNISVKITKGNKKKLSHIT